MSKIPRKVLAAFAALTLGLAGYGYYAHWPENQVELLLGIGSSLLIVLLAGLLMPRWWKEQCEDDSKTPAAQGYRRQVLRLMLVYAVTLFASTWLLKHGAQPIALRALIAHRAGTANRFRHAGLSALPAERG